MGRAEHRNRQAGCLPPRFVAPASTGALCEPGAYSPSAEAPPASVFPLVPPHPPCFAPTAVLRRAPSPNWERDCASTVAGLGCSCLPASLPSRFHTQNEGGSADQPSSNECNGDPEVGVFSADGVPRDPSSLSPSPRRASANRAPSSPAPTRVTLRQLAQQPAREHPLGTPTEVGGSCGAHPCGWVPLRSLTLRRGVASGSVPYGSIPCPALASGLPPGRHQ